MICKLAPLLVSSLICVFIPKEGDLLFQDIDCGPLCDAIEEVTVGIDGAKFSHIGLVVYDSGSVFVLEAISKGVVLTPLNKFLERSVDSAGHPKVIVGRIQQDSTNFVHDAVNYAMKFIGATYDTVFSMENNSWYCSEIIYLSFKSAAHYEFFKLAPMTFKSPGSDSIFSEWQLYFDAMGIEVPEGKPGINPGGISLSDRIKIVHVYGNPDGYVPAAIE
jgi:hypothetical protein